ncbi:MAG: hypothetical protein HYY06_33065 [Deltaproteobacteria bacterium]|nr:hypothetical protein [Deltaproteobacteria bacterium]
MADRATSEGSASEWTWDGVRDAQLRATAASTPAERLRMVEEMIGLAFQAGALPVYRVAFRPAVEVRVDAGHLEAVVEDQRETDSFRTFRVLSASLRAGARHAADHPGVCEPPGGSPSRENLPVGEVVIVDARGEERLLPFERYLDLVGREGEFADRQPVDWRAFSRQLDAVRGFLDLEGSGHAG